MSRSEVGNSRCWDVGHVDNLGFCFDGHCEGKSKNELLDAQARVLGGFIVRTRTKVSPRATLIIESAHLSTKNLYSATQLILAVSRGRGVILGPANRHRGQVVKARSGMLCRVYQHFWVYFD